MPFQFTSYFCHDRQSHGLNYTCAVSKNAISCALKTTVYISIGRVKRHLLVPELLVLVPHIHVHKFLADTFVATLSSPQKDINRVTTTNYSPPPTIARALYARKYTSPHIDGPNVTKCGKRKYLDAPSLPRTYCSRLVFAFIIFPPEHYLPYKLPHPVSRSVRRRHCRPYREDILKQVSETPGWERLESHPRRRLLAAMVGLLEYSDRAQAGVQEKRRGWWKLTNRQREVRILVLSCIVAIRFILQ